MKEAHMQYTIRNGTYVRCGGTAQSVPAGFYDVIDTGPAGGFGLHPKKCVTDELILVPGTVADEIFRDIDAFMDRREEFRRFGLTHKRGYMMHGPGGSGKTSIGLMIAHRFIEKLGGVVIFAPDSRSFYHGVSIMRDIEPGRPSLYLIEEADRIVNNTHCLSILDGELAIEGAIFVAMTNFKGKLPPRVTNRPGRFARITLVAAPPKPVQVEYLSRLAARAPASMNGRLHPFHIVEGLTGIHMTMDHLREAFVSHVIFGEDLPSIRERFEEMAKEPEGEDEEFGNSDWWSPADPSDD